MITKNLNKKKENIKKGINACDNEYKLIHYTN